MCGTYLLHLSIIKFKWLIALRDSFPFVITCYLRATTGKGVLQWERDLGPITGDQWEGAYQVVLTCSPNGVQKLNSTLFYTLIIPLRL